MTDRLNALLAPLVWIMEWVLFLFLFLLVGLTFTQVVLRYVFNSYLFWGDEVIFFLFTWLIFLSAAVGLARGSHFSVDLVVQLLPAPLGRWCAALVQLVVG
ncbi:MAG: TRAP transporter small permease subunit, partial [Chloroflexi bacterium]|nr:TRAP transporter small permease subunit [Chloroflexota bacterium]